MNDLLKSTHTVEPLEARTLLAATAVATNLNNATNLQVAGNSIYFINNTASDAVISQVPKMGGGATTVLDEPALSEPDEGMLMGYNQLGIDGPTISAGRGDYDAYTIDIASTGSGPSIPVATLSGGYLVGVSNGQIYFGSNFNAIDSVPVTGGNISVLAAGYWMRSTAIDSNSIYFVDYLTKDVDRFDFSTNTVTPLITGAADEGSIFIDASNVYFNIDGNIETVPKAGGQVRALVDTGTATGYTADGINIYYVEDNTIFSMPLAGGAPTSLISIPANSLSSLAVDDTSVYWTDNSGGAGAGKILTLPKPNVALPGAPSVPRLIAPTSGSTIGFGSTFKFAATNPKERMTYQLELQAGTTYEFYSTTTAKASGATASYTVPVDAGIPFGIGTWRVRAKNTSGIYGPWSSGSSITFGAGIDALVPLNPRSLQIAKDAGGGYFIAPAFGGVNPYDGAEAQLDEARSDPYDLATAAYCLLNFSRQTALNGSQQMDGAISALGDALPYIKFMAIDVESTSFNVQGKMITNAQAVQRIQQAINELESVAAAKHTAPIPVVIYTRVDYWNAIIGKKTGNPFPAENIPLWEPTSRATKDAGLATNFVSYAGWTTRSGKQYLLDSNQFGIPDVDLDVFDPSLFS